MLADARDWNSPPGQHLAHAAQLPPDRRHRRAARRARGSPCGRSSSSCRWAGVEEIRISAEEYETAFEKLWHHACTKAYGVKTTEAPHYRRWVLQHGGHPLAAPRAGPRSRRRVHRPPWGDRRRGRDVRRPNGESIQPVFSLVSADSTRFRRGDLRSHPVFQALQDPDRYRGRCGACEYRHVCGGSRARAYAVTGDYLEGEPDCVHVPGSDPEPKLD